MAVNTSKPSFSSKKHNEFRITAESSTMRTDFAISGVLSSHIEIVLYYYAKKAKQWDLL
jgi:hypothetical protein